MSPLYVQQNQNNIPTRMYMDVPGLDAIDAHILALEAVDVAYSLIPKFSGRLARSLRPLWGNGYFGISWRDPAVWYQEVGIRPFTMRSLAGKTIPMWIKDPDGEERKKNPKAEVKVGEDGVVRVLVFRRAAKQGQRKVVMRSGVQTSVPRSYPGAPGRISVREAAAPYTREGKVGGRIAGDMEGIRRNVGVRWRHPGLTGRSFLFQGLVKAAQYGGIDPSSPVHATNSVWR